MGANITLTCNDIVNKLESSKAWLTAELVQLVVQDNLYLHNLLFVTHCTLMYKYWWWLVIAHLVILLHARLCTEILQTETYIPAAVF
jgi:ABC-type multidrug transport system fused ATPase/permease subunit